MKFLWFQSRRPKGPTSEAIEARAEAGAILQRAEDIYSLREHLLSTNHFAERIRFIYEGH